MLGRKGISTVIGASLMGMLVLSGLSVVIWQVQQMDAYQTLVSDKVEGDFDRLNEIIKITEVQIESNQLNVSVWNQGSFTTHLVSLYITEYNGSSPDWRQHFLIDHFIAPTLSMHDIGQSIPITFQNNGTYGIMIVTERGNIASYVYGIEGLEEQKSKPLTFVFDYESFNYTTSSDGEIYKSQSRPAWEMDGGDEDIIFWVKCINNGAKDIELSNYSFIFLKQPFPSPDGQHTYEYEHYYFILDNSSISDPPTGVFSYTSFSQVIPANHTDYKTGTPAILKFGADEISGSQLKVIPNPIITGWDGGTPSFAYQYYMYIMVFWRYSGDDTVYSQIVQYATIQVSHT